LAERHATQATGFRIFRPDDGDYQLPQVMTLEEIDAAMKF
jgi:hypothetical protein